MLSERIPGTNIRYSGNADAFDIIRPMIEMTGGLTKSQLVKITGISTYSLQNWATRGYIPRAENKKYLERHVARVLIINAMKDALNVEEIQEIMSIVNGDTEDESDDIISDSTLFDYFCRVVRRFNEDTLSEENVIKAVNEVLKDIENVKNKTILRYALKIMAYAYISGKCLEQINLNKKELIKFKEV